MTAQEKKLLEKELNQIISDCLFGPGGGPDSSHLWAAARAFGLLERLGLKVKAKKEIENILNVEAGEGTFLYWARQEEKK